MTPWGTNVEKEIRNRILISVYAYAYEVEDDVLVSDAVYDKLATEIDELMDTGNKKMDDFFSLHYENYTGQWIHKHPELDNIKEIYKKHFCL